MNKKLLLGLPLLALSLGASAQVELRQADLMRLHEIKSMKHTDASSPRMAKSLGINKLNQVEVIVRYDSEEALEQIKANGGEILSLVGTRTAIVSVDPANVEAVAGSRGVTGARLSRLMKHANNKARVFSNIEAAQNYNADNGGFKGKGVVVGLFDTGLDPNHINFRDADGNNRVKKVFEYVDTYSLPDIYENQDQISTFTTDTRQESHGTHVLGIMGGSFYDSETTGAVDYRGVAPEADLVVACGPGYDAQILNAMEQIAKYAKEEGKPCVINLSFGDNVGPHDGTDEFTEALNDIAEKYDAVICLAGGNERDEAISIIKQFTEDDPYVKTLTIKGYTDGDYQTFGNIEIWGEDSTPFEVSLDIISKSSPNTVIYSFPIPTKKAGYVAQGKAINDYINTSRATVTSSGTEFQTYYSESFMGGMAGVDAYNKRYNAQIVMYLVPATSSYGNKYFVRLTVKGEPGKKAFVYCDGAYMNFGNKNIPGLDVPDGAGTNSNMASGKNTIAVGSYVSANRSGSGYPSGTIGDISYFSSYGETPDGRTMPDICAPGQVIISSRNSYLATTGNAVYYYPLDYNYKDEATRKSYYWTSCAGTSQSSPHAAGIIALWRQANPQLTYTDLQQIARETAAAPKFNSVGWGAGKIDALAGIKAILGESSVYDIIETASESILIENEGNVFSIYAPGQTALKASVYALQGMEVKAIATDDDTLTLDASGLPAGIYVMKVNGSHTARSLKFTVK